MSEPMMVEPAVERIDRIEPQLRERLLQIWIDVSNAGGWVGFVPPVDRSEVSDALQAALARVEEGRDWLVVIRTGPGVENVVGMAFLADNDRLLSRHWRWVLRVQIHPSVQGNKLGARLLNGLSDLAAQAGLETLFLTVRGGEGLERFYAQVGFEEVARLPGAIRVSDGDDRDQVILRHQLN